MKVDLEGLLPHAGAMRLIGAVLHWDAASIRCEAVSHRDPGNPLRRNGVLPILCGLEYSAQAMAMHGALRAGRASRPRVGYLVAAHDLRWRRDRLDDLDEPILVHASCLLASADRVAYAFELTSASQALLLSGRGSVVLSA